MCTSSVFGIKCRFNWNAFFHETGHHIDDIIGNKLSDTKYLTDARSGLLCSKKFSQAWQEDTLNFVKMVSGKKITSLNALTKRELAEISRSLKVYIESLAENTNNSHISIYLSPITDSIGTLSLGKITYREVDCKFGFVSHDEPYYFSRMKRGGHSELIAAGSTECLANLMGAVYTESDLEQFINSYMPNTAAAFKEIIASVVQGGL